MNGQSIENGFPCHVPDRVLDESLLTFDLEEIIHKIKQEKEWTTGDRNSITLLKNPHLAIVLIALHGQGEINFHRSGNLISVHLLEGKVNFQTKDKSVILKKGILLTCHEEGVHSLVALEDSVFLLTIGSVSAASA